MNSLVMSVSSCAKKAITLFSYDLRSLRSLTIGLSVTLTVGLSSSVLAQVGHTCVYNCGGSEPTQTYQQPAQQSAPSQPNPYSEFNNQLARDAGAAIGTALGTALREMLTASDEDSGPSPATVLNNQAVAVGNLAKKYRDQHQWELALKKYQESLQLLVRARASEGTDQTVENNIRLTQYQILATQFVGYDDFGHKLVNQGRFAAAKQKFETALQIALKARAMQSDRVMDQNIAITRSNLRACDGFLINDEGNTALAAGNYETAIRDYEKAIKLAPSDKVIRANLLMAQSCYAGAKQDWAGEARVAAQLYKYKATPANLAWLHEAQGDLAYSKGNMDDALKLYEKAARDSTDKSRLQDLRPRIDQTRAAKERAELAAAEAKRQKEELAAAEAQRRKDELAAAEARRREAELAASQPKPPAQPAPGGAPNQIPSQPTVISQGSGQTFVANQDLVNAANRYEQANASAQPTPADPTSASAQLKAAEEHGTNAANVAANAGPISSNLNTNLETAHNEASKVFDNATQTQEGIPKFHKSASIEIDRDPNIPKQLLNDPAFQPLEKERAAARVDRANAQIEIERITQDINKPGANVGALQVALVHARDQENSAASREHTALIHEEEKAKEQSRNVNESALSALGDDKNINESALSALGSGNN